MPFELYLVLFLVIAFLLTGALRVYALKKNVIDIPNERSSHTVPTPRGGGVSVVICFLAGLLFSGFTGLIDLTIALLFFGAGLLVALIGWLDDHGHVNARWRLLVHFSSASLVVYACGGLPVLSFFGWDVDFGWAGYVVAVIALVWILNLYNFMDGIDGIAGGQAVIATVVMGLLLLLVFNQQGYANLHWLMAVSALGFLLWNFPPAKIFMGDAGSGFLGLMLGALLLLSGHVDQSLFWAWLIMLGVFVVDATFTLLRRLLRGDKVHEAHRSHAYQYASRKLGQHKIVTVAVLLLNIFWLAPWAYIATTQVVDGFLALLIAYVPLIGLAIYFRAGELEEHLN